MASFMSDNNAGLCPEALEAIVQIVGGPALAYGGDSYTAQAVELFQSMFGRDTSVFFVATGTAGNTLAIASLGERWQRVISYEYSHCATDESTAPERITGCRMTTVSTSGNSKLTTEDVTRHAKYPAR